MTLIHQDDYYKSLVNELRKQPKETEWVEFKRNNGKPDEIGEYISALANSAALHRKVNAYLVWGIDDNTHDIVGTSFNPSESRVGGEELESWLLHLVSPKIEFAFRSVLIDEKNVCLLEIDVAHRVPVQFSGAEYIRIGSYKKRLKEYPEKERALWRYFDSTPFERQIAECGLHRDEVIDLINYPDYFRLNRIPLPAGADEIMNCLMSDELVEREDSGRYCITNIGAILYARDLSKFKSLKRKAVRLVQYDGNNRVKTTRERTGNLGYASGFEGLIRYINDILPSNELIGAALRNELPLFPELAVRELVANCLIHQDFSQTGNGPMIELFANRMEITNPGKPLMQTNRFLDSPPRSRNEALASKMRRIGVCEERGSGIDKVVVQSELYQLPAPKFEEIQDSTKATLFSHKELKYMDKDDKTRACYLHSCLKCVSGEQMTNSSLRERFKVEERNRALISRIINDTLSEGLIMQYDPEQGKRHAKYVPFWAGPKRT
jgi:predicted HTH transcriptional regulator